MNDLENIPMFWIIALVYLFTRPPVALVCVLYFSFLIVRIVHTIVYAVYVVPQPTRSILFMVGLTITAYMAIHAMIIGFCHL